MRSCIGLCFAWFLSFGMELVRADEPAANKSVANRTPNQVVEKALTFLVEDTMKWHKDRGCATCHHGTLTVWALSEAKSQGYAVPAETLADTIMWTKEQFVPRFKKPRDPRPGWNLVSIPAIYLGMMSQNLPILSRDELNQVAMHLARHQEDDGTWLLPPPANGAPPVWESRETLAQLALLAWEPHIPADSKEAATFANSREKTVSWLRNNKSSETVQAVTLRLLLDLRTQQSPQQVQSGVEQLLKRQNPDGGWSQVPEFPGDAYATGQALYALSFAGVPTDKPEIQRAISFLMATQRDDGSWPMESRNHPGVETTRKPIRNPIPITYFGSAWATLGLVRTVPSALDTIAKQQRAFDQIRGFHGKFDVDETRPERPVVRVDLKYYEVSDDEVALLAQVLRAFPQLKSLEFKSTKITDAGLAHLARMSQLQSLVLENAVITNDGLMHIKQLTKLERLDLKGTKVTEAGIVEFRKTLPNARIDR